MEYKESHSSDKPFRKMKIKLKEEIVTLGVEVKPRDLVGHYLDPKEWNDLIARDDVILIDTRNDYEYKAGTFKGAIDPKTETFREFPEYVKKELEQHKDKKLRCSVLVVFAVKNQLLYFFKKDLKRFTILKAVSLST